MVKPTEYKLGNLWPVETSTVYFAAYKHTVFFVETRVWCNVRYSLVTGRGAGLAVGVRVVVDVVQLVSVVVGLATPRPQQSRGVGRDLAGQCVQTLQHDSLTHSRPAHSLQLIWNHNRKNIFILFIFSVQPLNFKGIYLYNNTQFTIL